MPISPYIRELRAHLGTRLLLIPSVTAIIFDAQRRVLLVEDISTGRWTAPGGSLEPGELPSDSLVREMREELNVTVEPICILGVFGGGPDFVVEYANGDRTTYVMTVFECRIIDGVLAADGHELARFRFVDADNAASLPLAPWVRHILRHLESPHSGARFDPPSS